MKEIRKVCVIGAGTMGSGIAAHLANLGFEVTLLDRSQDSARAAFELAKSARPPHFYLPGTAETVRLGSTEENLNWVSEADWVCEAVVEKLEVKRGLFGLIEPLLRPDAMISTNTSGLQIELLCEGRSDSFRRRFLGTHFFNPPRHLKLLELIPTSFTDQAVVESMTQFLERQAARRVVLAKDTPGFIANRFGMWSMYQATHSAEKLDLTIEQVDEITGPFIGRPRSGSFRLNDLVGLDIMEDIAQNLLSRCGNDLHLAVLKSPVSLTALREKGWIGNKAGQGYYRKEGRELLSFDLRTQAYRQRQEPEFGSIAALSRLPLAERLRQGLELRDEVGEFLRAHLIPTLAYADYLRAEISHSVLDFDRVMMWGFGWEAGPFAMIDMIGAERLGISGGPFYASGAQRSHDGEFAPIQTEPDYAIPADFPLVESRETINLRNFGDGVTGLCLKTKMGVFSPLVIDEMTEWLTAHPGARVILTSEAKCYSAGFDLKFFVEKIQVGDFEAIDEAIEKFQRLADLLGARPSVAAIFGYCLGGGLEMAMGCTRIVAAPETQVGLPESKVGLIPGGGGTLRMKVRHQSSAKDLAESIRTVAKGELSTNADHARSMGWLSREDVTIYHPDRLWTEAKQLVMQISAAPSNEPRVVAGPVSGMADQMLDELKKAGEMSDHDLLIGQKLREVMSRSTSHEDALLRERRAFLELCQEGLSLARMKHMLDSGKPLRN